MVLFSVLYLEGQNLRHSLSHLDSSIGPSKLQDSNHTESPGPLVSDEEGRAGPDGQVEATTVTDGSSEDETRDGWEGRGRGVVHRRSVHRRKVKVRAESEEGRNVGKRDERRDGPKRWQWEVG